jgi:hypothetical protein
VYPLSDIDILALFFAPSTFAGRREAYVKLIPQGRIVLAGCLCVAVVGCGASATKTAATKTSTTKTAAKAPTATPLPVTPALTLYAQVVLPVARSGITQATTLIKQMQITSSAQLGKVCVQAAGGLSNNRDAFNSVIEPAAAKTLRGDAKQAYQAILSSTDECGIAADSGSASGLSQAAQDMKKGISRLSNVESTLAGWAAKH